MTAESSPSTVLDLNRRRDVGDLLSAAFTTWFKHLPVFIALAFIVVAPVNLLINGLWLGTTTDLNSGDLPPAGPFIASIFAGWLIVPPLVTAMHVAAVIEIGEGRKPSIGNSIRVALKVFPIAAAVVFLYGLITFVGLILLVIPGIFVGVLLYFGAQAVVADRTGVVASLKRSRELVTGNWWRTFGILLLFGIIAGVAGGILGALLGGIAAAITDSEILTVISGIVSNTITQSLTALAATLLYFDLRVRNDGRVAAESRPFATSPEHPETA